MSKQKLAIIGTGIAGMGAAHKLKDNYDITLFEKNDYVGGHTNTVYVEEDDKKLPIDTGFIVFNKVTYPNLVDLFNELNVPITKTDMTFSVQHKASKLEYNGSGFNGIFSQRRNIFNISFIKMILQINRFNGESVADMKSGRYNNYTIEEYLIEKKYGSDFILKYIIPMSSAVWSSEVDVSLRFPFITLVRFFENHGLLGLNTQHQWYTVVGGSETYKQKLIEPFKDKICINKGVVKIVKKADSAEVYTSNGEKFEFAKVVVATHADEALGMLESPSKLEYDLLSKFKYQKNLATLHMDSSVMPLKRKVWSAWNYRISEIENEIQASTVYYMNQLQKISDKRDYFLSINHGGTVDEKKILREFIYYHPLFTLDSIDAQKQLDSLNDSGPIYFCGSYFNYGFHEDALTSGINVSNKILG